MATTRTDFGEPILNLQRIIQYVSDNVACKTIKLSIQTFSSVEKFVFINEPEVGTTNTFRFEVNGPVSSLLISDFPELLNLSTALSGSKFLSSDIYVFVSSELDSNGNVLEATPFFFPNTLPL